MAESSTVEVSEVSEDIRRGVLLANSRSAFQERLEEAKRSAVTRKENGSEVARVRSKKRCPGAECILKRFSDSTWYLHIKWPGAGEPVMPDNHDIYGGLLLVAEETFKLSSRGSPGPIFEHTATYWLHSSERIREDNSDPPHPEHRKRQEILEDARRPEGAIEWVCHDPDPLLGRVKDFADIAESLETVPHLPPTSRPASLL